MNHKPNKITKLFGIDYPIIQGGMVWVSGGKLAAAVSRAGGLGIIGAGSMQPELLQRHITKAQSLTSTAL
jgi:enoyl-[acyl-carrier protein] reductase II